MGLAVHSLIIPTIMTISRWMKVLQASKVPLNQWATAPHIEAHGQLVRYKMATLAAITRSDQLIWRQALVAAMAW